MTTAAMIGIGLAFALALAGAIVLILTARMEHENAKLQARMDEQRKRIGTPRTADAIVREMRNQVREIRGELAYIKASAKLASDDQELHTAIASSAVTVNDRLDWIVSRTAMLARQIDSTTDLTR